MARTYIISEICGDWALQIREPGHPHQFLYFNSENNADLVKSILEWEDAHQNEAVPYKPTLTQPNEWVSAEDAVPDPGVRVLAANGNFVGEAYMASNGAWMRHDGFPWEVDAWMPMPDRRPPEGDA